MYGTRNGAVALEDQRCCRGILVWVACVCERLSAIGGRPTEPKPRSSRAQDMSYNRIKTLVNEELKSYFRPEFLNRLDEIIVFRQLTKKEVKQIADIFLRVGRARGAVPRTCARIFPASQVACTEAVLGFPRLKRRDAYSSCLAS